MYLICALISIFSTCTAAATTIYYKDDGSPDYERINEDMEQEKMEWISVEIKVPPIGEEHRLLFVNGKGEVTFGYAYNWKKENDRYVWINDMDRETNEIATHWMPLPSPPTFKDGND